MLIAAPLAAGLGPMLAKLKTEWMRGLVAGAGITIIAVAGMMALPGLVSNGTATTVQQELRHVHLDQAANSDPAIEQRYLKLSSIGSGADQPIDDLDVGDRLTIGGKDGLKSVLEIVSVKTASVRLDTNNDGQRSVLKVIMARDLEAPERPLVRLIYDAGAAEDVPAEKLSQAPRAL